MNRVEALTLVKDSILEIAPDVDLNSVGPDDKFRVALELDSLDFLSLVELLSERSDIRIVEDDYPALTTLSDCAGFLADRS
ncbi:acyl carrier protein [Streptomyces sp. HUAS TT7]|uniref:acyl carrier protein n=1 Tax=Streptomyces sp. HUAS TT7 TaxID=3447507 RepID=UPI003F65B86E